MAGRITLRHGGGHRHDPERDSAVATVLVDPEENNNRVAEFEVELAEARKTREAGLKLRRVGSLV